MHHSHLSRKRHFCGFQSLPPTHCCTILESVNEGVVTFDLNKTVTYINPAAEAITGFAAQTAIGRKCSELLRSEFCQNRCPTDELVAGKTPLSNLRARIITRSGAMKTVSLSIALLLDDDGKTTGVVETFRDLSELEQLRKEISRKHTIEDIVGRSPRMRNILSSLPDIAESDSSVLIEGATGTGKELIAKAIHHLSRRKNGPFIAVNCAALPDGLLESELFGHTKGAFTGALKDRPGRFALADGGTLFLDEIGSTSMAFQADLLRVLQDGHFVPVGGSNGRYADFRLIVATNEDLMGLTHQDRFRTDLYYRIGVAKIRLPDLAERKEDIPILIDHFIQKFNLIKSRTIKGVTPEAIAVLFEYAFPGNIRELENIIEYAFIGCKGKWIEPEHFPVEMRDCRERSSDVGNVALSSRESDEALKIRVVLERFHGNRIETAKTLGIGRATLWRKIKKYGLK